MKIFDFFFFFFYFITNGYISVDLYIVKRFCIKSMANVCKYYYIKRQVENDFLKDVESKTGILSISSKVSNLHEISALFLGKYEKNT